MLYIALYFIPAAFMMIVTHIVMKSKYTLKELAAQAAITFFVVCSVFLLDGVAQIRDHKLVHGVVTSKEDIRKSCRITWQTYQDSWCEHHHTKIETERVRNSDGSYRTESTTYYKPVYPWERKFFVNTSIGTYEIKRVDRQGVRFPERYNIVNKNDPVSDYKSYDNYVAAAAKTIFRYEDDAYVDLEVKPNKVFDYYRIRQFYFDGIKPPSENLNLKLSNINSSFKNGANLFFFVTDKPEDFAKSLQVKWKGFKINDVAVVLGVDKETNIYQYVHVYSWSESSMVETLVRDHLKGSDYSKLSADLDEISEIVAKEFVEPNPDKFKYLKAQIGLTWFSTILLILITLVVTPTVTYFLSKE